MSEEILKALMHLFAIITKQDEGVTENERKYVASFLQQQLNEDAANEYLNVYDDFAGLNAKEEENGDDKKKKRQSKLTSVKDSVRTLAICKKINKTLTQRQKVVVLVRLFELVKSDNKLTPQRMQIIDTVSTVFNIEKEEYEGVENFVVNEDLSQFDSQDVMVIDDNDESLYPSCKHIPSGKLDGSLIILRIKSVEMYFLRYTGTSEVILNGLYLNNRRIYLFANGSSLRTPKGQPIYYSDVVAHFLSDSDSFNLSFVAKDVEYRFPNGKIGLRGIDITEGAGKLIAIMGASGAGKTTLLNVLSGIEKPSKGAIQINGINTQEEKDKIEGVIGYIPQDDLLIEELTVYQNLYYNAKLCFKDLSDEEIDGLVMKVLANLGLTETKDLKVGNPLDKKISGGQRKRLNIALELIREPSVLFVDEPTSGLSSRDSENVMDLLRELALKGKLIFVVIHQPSSEIYKMFDKIILLDVGGYPIFYDNPVEAVMYFKRLDNQINSDVGECPVCGNVNPELIFNIIEAKVVDEYGNLTDKRKVSPRKWNDYFLEYKKKEEVNEVSEDPPKALNIPNRIKQLFVFITRDLLSKITNTQYMLINFLEAPLLAFVLAFIIRYIDDPLSDDYLFRENENVPPYIFMSIIVALFMGLTVSAEEIIRDRKILKREAFLNLSRSSYLFSKIIILFSISAIQTLSFVLIGNALLGISGMTFSYWMMLFSVSAFANMLGLNVSASFNSAVTIYILIPLLLIPQMILSGAIFSFDKLNRIIGSRSEVPLIADMMVARWAFEGLVVNQFKSNEFFAPMYRFKKKESSIAYNQTHLIPEIINRVNTCKRLIKKTSEEDKESLENCLILVKNEVSKKRTEVDHIPFQHLSSLEPAHFTKEIAETTVEYLNEVKKHYGEEYLKITKILDRMINKMVETPEKEKAYFEAKDKYFNQSLEDLLLNISTRLKVVEENQHLIQQIDPIYKDPVTQGSWMNYRSHFYAPRKHFAGMLYDTYGFNLIVIWLFSLVLYFTLYFESFKKLMDLFSRLNFKTRNSEAAKG